MANSKQQMKRARSDQKRRLANNMFRSSLKRSMKQVELLANEGQKEKAVEAYNTANKKLDKSISKGIHNKQYVARHKSRLSNLINQIEN